MTSDHWLAQPAHVIANAVRSGEVSASALMTTTLGYIEDSDRSINAFTAVTDKRAHAAAETLDRQLARQDTSLHDKPLLGVPFAVKNLFDIEGLPTLAGSKLLADAEPAPRDAVLVRRLEAAGAILVGALNMDEFAYGFTTENTHYGPTRNPHDLTRLAGGSSGGSAAAVAAGQVPLTLGSDTNGSIRVPASLCGVYGLKPTYGRLPRTGSYPFVGSLDHLGPFARSVHDLALTYDVLQGYDADDPGCVRRPREPVMPVLEAGIDGLRIARLGGYFSDFSGSAATTAMQRVANALGATHTVELPEVNRARAAAFVITNAEGATLHMEHLRHHASQLEPLSRDRFLAGALLPAAWVIQAQRVRRWFALQAAELLGKVDVLLAPATPVPAPVIGTEWLDIGGQRLPARPSLGLLTQPISCIGLPVCCVPVWNTEPGDAEPGLPMGIQIIAAPWREDIVLRVAHALERAGVTRAPVAIHTS